MPPLCSGMSRKDFFAGGSAELASNERHRYGGKLIDLHRLKMSVSPLESVLLVSLCVLQRLQAVREFPADGLCPANGFRRGFPQLLSPTAA
ncbi:hypothetical protein SAMN00790413_04795 [Deinococcus hopiensis KR-140]|uniref:Uncharacterized protein n=1 Tax=Deinococcus hopiensis KR-140 TaxID=695939 RepID=A0A1W1UME5_9DEIO|nr:hypothetical protein SAMN00790413_04795 [Deinococcus hopiensis KR-140]